MDVGVGLLGFVAVGSLVAVAVDDTMEEQAKELIQNDKPSDSTPIFWLYDIKTITVSRIVSRWW